MGSMRLSVINKLVGKKQKNYTVKNAAFQFIIQNILTSNQQRLRSGDLLTWRTDMQQIKGLYLCVFLTTAHVTSSRFFLIFYEYFKDQRLIMQLLFVHLEAVGGAGSC